MLNPQLNFADSSASKTANHEAKSEVENLCLEY